MYFSRYIRVYVCVFMLFGLASSAAAGDVTGDWIARSGEDQFRMTLQSNGMNLTGTVDTPASGKAAIQEGIISGGEIHFHVQRTMPGFGDSKFKVVWAGKVTGDEIQFTRTFAGNSLDIVARRAKSDPETAAEQANDTQSASSISPSVDISGRWSGLSPRGRISLEFQVAGSTLTGTVNGDDSDETDILDGNVQGDSVSFYLLRSQGGNQFKVVWKGKIAGDEIQFQVTAGPMKMTVVASRQDSPPVPVPPTVDPTGTWIAQADGSRIAMAFQVVGMSLTGKIWNSQSGTTDIRDGKISGDTISFYVLRTFGRNRIKIPWEGKISGNEIRFKRVTGNQTSEIIAKRAQRDGSPNVTQNGEPTDPIVIEKGQIFKNEDLKQNYEKLRETDSEYDSAMNLYDKSRHFEALPLMEQLLKRYPKDPVVIEHLAVCLIMTHVSVPSAEERKEIRARARSLLIQARELGFENALLDYYVAALPEDGGQDTVFSSRDEVNDAMKEGEAAFARRDYEAAIVAYSRAMELDPNLYTAILFIGDSYYGNNQNADAAEWFERASKTDPSRETAFRYWGDALMRQGKMNEARSRFIEAIVAEPYNRMSWNGLTQWVNRNKLRVKTPNIDKPRQPVVSPDPGGTKKDGMEAWVHYFTVVEEWKTKRFSEEFPGEKEYRHTMKEETEALELVADAVNEDLKRGRLSEKELAPGIATLLELRESGLLESYILIHLADKGIVEDYPAYRESNRDKLYRYLDEFVVPKISNRFSL